MCVYCLVSSPHFHRSLQRRQQSRKAETRRQDRLADAVHHRQDRRHRQVRGSMYKGNGGTADAAPGHRRHHAHHQDEDGEEPAELVLAQRHERHDRRTGVDNDRREQCPQEDVVPHIYKLGQRTRAHAPQTEHVRYRVQFRKGFGIHCLSQRRNRPGPPRSLPNLTINVC